MTAFNVGDQVVAIRDTMLLDKGKRYQIAEVRAGRSYIASPKMAASAGLVSYPDDYFMRVFPTAPAPTKPVAPSVADDPRMTPKARVILRHLKAGKQITPSDALVVYGQSRLAAAIYEIRQAGYKVKTERAKDESGHGYSRYTLVI